MLTLFGDKSVAMFDVWSIEHVLMGISVARVAAQHNRKLLGPLQASMTARARTRFDAMGVLLIAFAWETVEHYLEVGLAGAAIAFWFHGVEAWTNRIVADPLLTLSGLWIATRWPRIVWPARIASLVWGVTHIFAFPHSMFLHEWIG